MAEKRRQEAEAEAAKFDALRATSAQAVAEATKAASHKREELFNYDGVNAIFTNTYQLNISRDLVTSPQFQSFLTFEQQPIVARRLQALAAAEGEELSGTFIRQRLTRLLLEQHNFSWSPTERRHLRQEDWNWEWQQAMSESVAIYGDSMRRVTPLPTSSGGAGRPGSPPSCTRIWRKRWRRSPPCKIACSLKQRRHRKESPWPSRRAH